MAQSVPDLECAERNAPAWLAAALVDDYLFDNGVGSGTKRPQEQALAEITQVCTEGLSLSPVEIVAFNMHNLAVIMAPEVRSQLAERGVDVAGIETLIENRLAVTTLSIEQYSFEVAGDLERAFPGVMDDERTGLLIGIYVAMEYVRRDFIANIEQ